MVSRRPVLALVFAACAGGGPPDTPPTLQSEPDVEYPPDLFIQGVAGTTELHLFVDSAGAVVPESTRVFRSSGTPALDSAALTAVPGLRYAPGTRDGQPAAMPFVQPIHFRPRP